MTQPLPFHTYASLSSASSPLFPALYSIFYSIFPRLLSSLEALLFGKVEDEGHAGSGSGFRATAGMPEGSRAFLEVVERYGRVIERICRSFATVVEEEADLRQDVLINIWKGMASFRAEADMKTWIYRVTMNTCVSSQRRRPKGEAVRLDTLPSSDSLPGVGGKEPGERSQGTYESSQWLQAMLNSLPLDDHAIMAMWLDDLPYDEIAGVMGMNRNTVATRVRRAKERLRAAVEAGRI